MNARQYALNEVRKRIPAQILDMVFKPKTSISPKMRWMRTNKIESIDSIINTTVIEDRVNLDCNLKGGKEIHIPLEGVKYDEIDAHTRVYYIPFSLTDNRLIVSALTLNYIRYNGILQSNSNRLSSTGAGGSLLNAARDMYRGMASMQVVSTANCEIIGDNVIVVKDTVRHMSDQLSMTVVLENDKAMTNLKPTAYKPYAKLVELATKAHIYNELAVTLDQGQLHVGKELGKIREIVDSYSDAQDQYDEFYAEKWGKVSFTNDRGRMYGYVSSMIGRGQ